MSEFLIFVINKIKICFLCLYFNIKCKCNKMPCNYMFCAFRNKDINI